LDSLSPPLGVLLRQFSGSALGVGEVSTETDMGAPTNYVGMAVCRAPPVLQRILASSQSGIRAINQEVRDAGDYAAAEHKNVGHEYVVPEQP
jgi:hypothetical protein